MASKKLANVEVENAIATLRAQVAARCTEIYGGVWPDDPVKANENASASADLFERKLRSLVKNFTK